MDYTQLGIGAAMIVLGGILWSYIKKIKSKFRRHILRNGGNNDV